LNRLTRTLNNLKDNNQKALVAYLVAGDPDLDSTLDLMHLFVESGVDVIEIGVPFTDPIAEGPTIQKAHDRALKNNISLKMIFDLVVEFRKKNDQTPIVLMGYLNTFISHIDLVESTSKIDSILVVDIPGELSLKDYGITNPNINTISLISPTTTDDRVELIAKNSTGFIYYVNLRGVTGSSNLNIDEIKNNIQKIKKHSDLPTLAGFGIKSANDAKMLSACSDGVIIGSSIVEMINESSNSKEFARIGEYLKEIKQAIS
jgi:tryptophan synthase alpha chain